MCFAGYNVIRWMPYYAVLAAVLDYQPVLPEWVKSALAEARAVKAKK